MYDSNTPPFGRDEGLRSPYRFPNDYNLTNIEHSGLQMPTQAYGSDSHSASTAPMYACAVDPGLHDLNSDIFNGVGIGVDDFGNYIGNEALGDFPALGSYYENNPQANFSYVANGELQFNTPPVGLDQVLGLHYQSPSMGFGNLSAPITPTQTFANTTQAQTFTSTAQSPLFANTAQAQTFANTTPNHAFAGIATEQSPNNDNGGYSSKTAYSQAFNDGIDQAFGGTTPTQTLSNINPDQTFNNTNPSQNSENTNWLLTRSVNNSPQDESSGNQAGSEESSSPYTKEQTTSDESSGNEASPGRRVFKTYEEFINAESRVIWKAPINDPSIPKTSAQMGVVVDRIIAAIRNNEGCVGKITKSFINRWSTGATFYADEDIEVVAWQVMLAMIDIHTKGWSKRIGDQALRKEIDRTKSWTFEKRLTELTEFLKLSKRTCEDLLKGDDPHAIIGVPDMLLKRTKSNELSNERKGERIRRASDQEKKEKAAAGQKQGAKRGKKRASDDDDDCAITSSSTPPKRAKIEADPKPKGKKRATKGRKTKKI